jgi:hypothetical protein
VTAAATLDVTVASAREVQLFADGAASEGWNPGLDAAAALHVYARRAPVEPVERIFGVTTLELG